MRKTEETPLEEIPYEPDGVSEAEVLRNQLRGYEQAMRQQDERLKRGACFCFGMFIGVLLFCLIVEKYERN